MFRLLRNLAIATAIVAGSTLPGLCNVETAAPAMYYPVTQAITAFAGTGDNGSQDSMMVQVIVAVILIMALIIILGFLFRSNKIVKQKSDQLKRITDNINEGLLVLDLKGTIKFANPVAVNILDYRFEQIVTHDYRRIFDLKTGDLVFRNVDCPINKALSDGNPAVYNNLTIQTKVGRQVQVDLVINPLLRRKSEIIGILVIIRDLTDSILAEKNISHWKRRYEFVSTAANQIIYEHYLDDNTIKWSRSIEKVLGYNTAELAGGYDQWKEKIHPDDREAAVTASETSRLNNTPMETEYRFRKKNGDYIVIKEKGAYITDDSGKPVRMLGVMQDITKQKQDEEEILKFKVISDNANYGAAILDFNWDIRYINKYFASIHGYKPDELIGRNISLLHNEEQMEHILNIKSVVKVKDQLIAEEVWHHRKDGSVFPMLVNFQKIRDRKDKPLFVTLTALDITDRKEFIKLIEEVNKRFKTLVTNVPGAVYRRLPDSNWTIKFISDEVFVIAGYNPDEFLDNKQRSYSSIIYFNDRAAIGQETYVSLREKRNYNVEYRIHHKDGSVRWVNERGRGIYDDEGNVLYCDGVIIDITERKKAEEDLKESEERLKMKLEYILSPDIDVGEFEIEDIIDGEKLQRIQEDFAAANVISSVIIDAKGELVTNPSHFSEMDKLILISMEGKRICYLHEETLTEEKDKVLKPVFNRCIDGRMLTAGVPIIVAGNYIADWFIGPCKTAEASDDELLQFADTIQVDSGKFLAAFRSMPVVTEERFVTIAELLLHVAQELSALGYNNIKLAKEITVRKEFEEQLRKSEQELRDSNTSKDKFLSIIAHDLKSPLAALRSMLDLLNANLSDFTEEDIKEIIGEMDNSAKNVYELLEDLLSWSRAQTGKIQFNPDNIDIKMIVNNNLSLMKHNADKKNIHLYASVPASIICYADANMVSTVIRNLVSNAVKFTFSGGEIRVSVIESDSFVEVSVSDTGIGMSQENIEKLFRLDTHVTTLGTSQEKGTGLGLILCKEFVENNDGRIWVESEQGKGSSFKFTLPKANLNI